MTRGVAAVNAEARAVAALLDDGYLRLYGGAVPVDLDGARPAHQAWLAELRFDVPAYDPPVNGTVTARPLRPELDAPMGGTATWFCAFQADGVTPVYGGEVGEDLLLTPQALIRRHARVFAGAVRYTARKA